MKLTQPPIDRLLQTFQGVQIYVFDATLGHRRDGWNHQQDRFLLIQWDPVDHADRGLVGSTLDTVLHATQHNITQRKKVRLN